MDTKEIILNSAKTLFLNNGYKNTTTRDIAKDAKVNLGLLSYHFKTKDHLASIIYDEIINETFKGISLDKYKVDNKVQKMFLMFILSQNAFLKKEKEFKLYAELLISDLIEVKPSYHTVRLSEEILKEFDLGVTPEEHHNYLLMLKSSERVLLKEKFLGRIDLDYIELNKLILKSHFSLLGVKNRIIYDSFDSCLKQVDIAVINSLY